MTAILAVALGACTRRPAPGENPHPVRLVRPAAGTLSPVADIGRDIFFDARLSGSGKISCATCHSPGSAYGPSNDLPVQLGGLSGRAQGARAVPSLRYLDRAPAFGIGPDRADADGMRAANPQAVASAARAAGYQTPRKTAGVPPAVPPMVPRGGLFWDGRAGTLQTQAVFPLLNPVEMANEDTGALTARIRSLGYADRLERALGTANASPRLLDEALFAVARFEFEDASFHPYSSRYDRWLEGKDTLTPAELRGLRVFEDPAKGNCAACHVDRPGPDGLPPAFTDWEYEALGVPRNGALAVNADPDYFDLGLCGPVRTDLARQSQWCGMFRTPSLRNVATRRAFFHNGVYHTLADVLRFYDFRDTRPDLVYPRGPDGRVRKFDDLPLSLAANVDLIDGPFDRHAGDTPPMSGEDMQDVIAFLGTLTDAPVAPTAEGPATAP
jgi:cytochrome c peroxidase